MSFDHENAVQHDCSMPLKMGVYRQTRRSPSQGNDPALVYLIFAWLRTVPSRSLRTGGGLGRIVEACTQSPQVAHMAKRAKKTSS